MGHSEGLRLVKPGPFRRNFPDFLTAYMRYSAHSESPEKFHFWTGVSILAGAIRKRVFIKGLTYYFDWTPNFYIIFVAPPGIVSKSTTANIGMELLREVPGVYFGPNSVTWQKLLEDFENARQEVIRHETGESEIMSAMTISSSELGNLLTFKDTEMLDHLVNLWDGAKTFKRSTRTQGDTTIDNPWLNILACTTPDWIAGNVPQYVIGGGFTSRCVFVYGEKKRHFKAYPGLDMDSEARAMRGALIDDLTTISQLEGEFRLTPAAIEWGKAWYAGHNSAGVDPDVAISGYMARKQTHLHKLAMILSLSQSNDLIIDETTLAKAAGILVEAEKEMHKVFRHVGQTVETRAIDSFITLVHANPQGITHAAAYNKFIRSLTRTVFTEVTNSAIASGLVKTANGKFYPQGIRD